MKKLFIMVMLVCMAAGLSVATAGAANENAAERYDSCPDTTFVSTVDGFTFEYCFSDVATSSGNANAQFHGTLLSDAPSKATTVSGFGCSAAFPNGGFTTDSKATITPSGNVNGSCKFRAP